VNNGIGLVGNVGKTVTTHANKTVRNVVKGRKNRKQTRRNRK
jgi:hypothetical protein